MGDRKVSFGRVTNISAENVTEELIETTGGMPETRAPRLRVELEGSRVGTLGGVGPREEIWAQFLASRQETGRPVYVESDSETGEVLTVLAPIRQRVEAVAPEAEDGVLKVVLFMSSTLFSVREERAKLVEILRDAAETGRQLLITADPDSHEILDSRPTEGGGHPEGISNGPITEAFAEELVENITFTLLGQAITHAQVTAEFRFLARDARIPFNYPDDCCKARAHEMCRLMRDHGIAPRKVWNYGRGWINQPPLSRRATLEVSTPNHPDGFVRWLYHVAPVVLVRVGSGFTRDMVIDPAMFGRHVTVNEWLAAQNDPASFYEVTDDAYFWRNIGNVDAQFDPDYAFTRESLEKHRLDGNVRAIRLGHPVVP